MYVRQKTWVYTYSAPVLGSTITLEEQVSMESSVTSRLRANVSLEGGKGEGEKGETEQTIFDSPISSEDGSLTVFYLGRRINKTAPYEHLCW